jgi:hypothetical protein
MKLSVYDLDAKPTLLGQKLTVNQVFSHPTEPSALAQSVLQGSDLYLKSLGLQSLLGRLSVPPTAGGAAAPTFGAPVSGVLAARPVNAATAANAAVDAGGKAAAASSESSGQLLPKLFGAVSAGGVATSSLHLMSFSQDMTQAQVTGYLQNWGLPPSTANSTADNVFELLNTHGAHSVLAGVTVGSATVAFLGVLRPAMPMKKRVALASIPAVIVGLAFYFFAYSPNPFTGKWVANPSEAHYEFGAAPQSATHTIDADANRIKISEDEMLPNGTVQHERYQLEADGRDHKAPGGTGADTVSVSMNGRSMETVYKNNGKEIRREIRSLSADRKEMTITVMGQSATGGTFTNTSVFEKK